MVVRLSTAMRLSAPRAWRLLCAAVILLGATPSLCVGAALMGTTQSHRFGGVSWMPGWQGTHGIEALLWNSEMQAIGMIPQQGSSSLLSTGGGVLLNNGGTVVNSRYAPSSFMPTPAWNSVNSQGTTLLPASQAPNPVNGFSDANLPPEEESYSVSSLSGTLVDDVLPAAPGNIQISCENMLPAQLQLGGELYWTQKAVTPAPVSFAPGEFQTGGMLWARRKRSQIAIQEATQESGQLASYPSPNSSALGDPVFAPTHARSNLILPGQGAAWCRPPHTPFSQTSPLASYIFWMPFLVLLGALMVLFLSRGVRLPRV